MAEKTTVEVEETAASAIEALQAKQEILAKLCQEHKGMFDAELANVESAIQSAVFNGKVGAVLDKLDITRIRGRKVEGVWEFTTLQTGSDRSNANGNSVRNKVWPHPVIRHDSIDYDSFAALCRFLKVPYGTANARAYLKSHSPKVYDRVVQESTYKVVPEPKAA